MIEEDKIKRQMSFILKSTHFPSLGERYKGKVRDNYIEGGKRTIITTDRISAFDVVLGEIPFKGQVLNKMTQFWFEQTKDIVDNHMISVPDPNVMVVQDCTALPVEMVVRGYLTGVTKTSAWTNYQNGIRNFCGNKLPDGLKKDQKFDAPILTPTTKGDKGQHDRNVSPKEIIELGLLSEEEYDEMAKVSLALFKRGTEICAKQGIILVDTKYEFGKTKEGKIILIDEIHTPDSSRFWFADVYQELFDKGEEQRKIDKEFVRTWYAQQGYRGDGVPPPLTDEIRIEAAKRYIQAYELITGQTFTAENEDVSDRIKKNLNL